MRDGWRRDVLVSVSSSGHITAVESASGATPDATVISGIVVPGIANAHSHAFQRAMAGNAEYRRSAHDSFWTWRQAMYALANRIEPRELEIIATQLFIEMLKAGYTRVAEFHYLHCDRGGQPYAGDNPLWGALDAAARASGIGLTLLPTLYQCSDFNAPLKEEQRRFRMDTEQFVRAIETRLQRERGGDAAVRTGAAFHSLRAVPLRVLRETADALRALDPALPLHIHVAEQLAEVQACERHTGRRPIELLLDTGMLDARWCLVHATHASAQELRGVARSGASVCLSITTEANLGDGFFDAAGFVGEGGHLCIGSDSQATVSPAEELRWLEYQQRLRSFKRGVLSSTEESHVGTYLWSTVERHGARAVGGTAGGIAVGEQADWLVLDEAHPALAGAELAQVLDHVVFAGGSAAIRDVMVAGRWVLRDAHHPLEESLRPRFSALLRQLNG